MAQNTDGFLKRPGWHGVAETGIVSVRVGRSLRTPDRPGVIDAVLETMGRRANREAGRHNDDDHDICETGFHGVTSRCSELVDA